MHCCSFRNTCATRCV